ncbi:hypothetical protein CDAR_618811 [Caerostris darwini]|uniref:Uncharacterized protein n=1 Tax=Caerostris darwini TaxID=1538125 RepID=A0AAV4W1N8_9ARAC|nr:hypothetical protein CDAR_248301 [Caerostris darwini]GIY79113.1 hypothetical protein CDAR_618811 [Caerostris darwini]
MINGSIMIWRDNSSILRRVYLLGCLLHRLTRNPEKVVLQGKPPLSQNWQILGETEVVSEELLGPAETEAAEAALGEDDDLTLAGFSCFFSAVDTDFDGLILRLLEIIVEEDLG